MDKDRFSALRSFDVVRNSVCGNDRGLDNGAGEGTWQRTGDRRLNHCSRKRSNTSHRGLDDSARKRSDTCHRQMNYCPRKRSRRPWNGRANDGAGKGRRLNMMMVMTVRLVGIRGLDHSTGERKNRRTNHCTGERRVNRPTHNNRRLDDSAGERRKNRRLDTYVMMVMMSVLWWWRNDGARERQSHRREWLDHRAGKRHSRGRRLDHCTGETRQRPSQGRLNDCAGKSG
jgi:hypothetical protein